MGTVSGTKAAAAGPALTGSASFGKQRISGLSTFMPIDGHNRPWISRHRQPVLATLFASRRLLPTINQFLDCRSRTHTAHSISKQESSGGTLDRALNFQFNIDVAEYAST